MVSAPTISAGAEPAASCRFEVQQRELLASAASFGSAGAYEFLSGRFYGAVDPAHPGNAAISLIEHAPRNSNGFVEYWADMAILKPVDMSRGNGCLLYDVLNRGEQKALTAFNDAPRHSSLRGDLALGNGFLMRRGYSMAWSGWQGDIASGAGFMHAGFPVARDGASPVTGKSREEFVFDSLDTPFIASLTYPANSLDQNDASLTVRRHTREAARLVDRQLWRYLSDRQIEIDMPEGYDGGSIFEFVYTARDPMVMGLAFAAIRDAVSYLRYARADTHPLQGDGSRGVDFALAFGTSQSGRVLRDLLWQGFNTDVDRRRVFDGVFIDGAGARKSFVNFPFAQPGRFSRQHEDHAFPGDDFPFTYGQQHDPRTGRADGILDRCDAAGATPKVIHTDSSSEYWQGRAALVHTDGQGRDLDLPQNVRAYLYASVQHGGPAARPLPIFAYPTNPLSETPLNRALLVALHEWVVHDIAPPASRLPKIADGTLVPILPRSQQGFPEIPGVDYPGRGNTLSDWDYTACPPVLISEGTYEPLVPRVDEAGNDVAGIRLPAVVAPVATYTGWNLRRNGYAPGELASVRGACFPFAATRAERIQTGDPRLSVQERYTSQAEYVRRIAAAAKDLETDRLLLSEDVERITAEAATVLPSAIGGGV